MGRSSLELTPPTPHTCSYLPQGDFNWQMQLRYEYDAEGDMVVVRQVNARCE